MTIENDPFDGEELESGSDSGSGSDPDVIELSDDGDDEEESPRPTRKEKKANRYRSLQEERDRLRAELEAERAQRMAAARYPQVTPAPAPKDDEDAELQAIYDEERLLQRTYASLSDEEKERKYDEYYDKAKKLEVRKLRTVAKTAGGSRPQTSEVVREILRMQHSDVYNHGADPTGQMPSAGEALHRSIWQRKLIVDKKPDTLETYNEAMEETRRTLRLPTAKRPAPDTSFKAKLTGTPHGATASSGSGPRTVKMTKEYKRMARAAYPHMDEDKAYQRWANTVGKDLQDGGSD